MASSARSLLKPSAWALEPEPSTFAPTSALSNEDMDPVPPHKRTWTTWNYVAYWISDATNVAVWELASSMLAIGLSWRQALPAIAVGHIIISLVMVLNGTIGARLHIPFPVLNRSSFGFWFSYFSVISRVVLSMFWFGIQTYTGSEAVTQMIKAIWPSYAHLPNHLSPSAHITTQGMVSYFIYWIIQLPLMLVSPQRIRWLFVAKATTVPAAWIAMLIWAFVKVPSGAPGGLLSEHTALSGSKLGWAWMSALNSALGIYSTLAVNIPDFTRYAKDERAQYVQLIIIPVAFTLVGFIGLAVTSSGIILYGQVLWDPLTLINQWDNRAAAFFASSTFLLATLGTNISANSLSAGNDIAALCPKWLNIRRGQVVCAFVGGWVLCPWEILASAAGFLSFMNGYTVFLGPFAGIMVTDYWLVHRGKVDVPAMYDPHGRYRYTGGFNWRACLALLISVPPNLPGLINSINTNIKVGGAVYVFDIAWLFGFTVASVVYYVTSVVWPAHETFMDEAIVDVDGMHSPGGHGSEGSELDEKEKPLGGVVMASAHPVEV
ncbi:cytosine-purine permease [Gloeophyllum trabeum ATCC 11539]|uniref:Cytosine-purine permease n=1 Tax=Gloeophyllum trabeum (strain ATCC 11539 / FP-39264 / Madison 617) TaxID=670483 RepID=S7RRY7_GLOTA|nr:cytosine-purine permease [Gloeophyllum trabeum ATCC 11539]EPQ55779.1 cytosine-purine permease [Gloeophyllum trabeum ATCC 11539]